MDGGEAEPGVVVDRHVQVLPAGALGSSRAIAGDAMAGPHDPAQLLDVDVHELTRRGTLVADDLLARRVARPAASDRAGEGRRARSRRRRRAPSRSRAALREARLARAGSPARPTPASACGERVRPARAITQTLASSPPVDPLRGRLPRAADDERRRGDRQPGRDEIADTLTLTDGQDRICMKIHKSPPLGRDSLTSRTLGGLTDTSDRQQRVWELQLGEPNRHKHPCKQLEKTSSHSAGRRIAPAPNTRDEVA